jgi:integrase/recombinase XerD
MDIVSIKELLGHAHIETTMIYLHVAKAGRRAPFSPLDTLYAKQ